LVVINKTLQYKLTNSARTDPLITGPRSYIRGSAGPRANNDLGFGASPRFALFACSELSARFSKLHTQHISQHRHMQLYSFIVTVLLSAFYSTTFQ